MSEKPQKEKRGPVAVTSMTGLQCRGHGSGVQLGVGGKKRQF